MTVKIGNIDIFMLSDGEIRLDGGGMYGVVPKQIWRRFAPPDRKNRVTLGLNCLLIRTDNRNILVDTGVGNKHPPRRRAQLSMVAGQLLASLRTHGLGPTDIHLVVLTHLHFDHAGGCTVAGPRSTVVPTFPRATYLVQRRDWAEATNTNERTRRAYLPEDFLPLDEHGQLELVDGDIQIAPGVELSRTGGHTAGHQMVSIQSEGRKAAWLGDVLPTHHHLPPHYVTAWDGYPLETIERKRRFLTQAESEQWLILFGHGVQERAGYVEKRDGRPMLAQLAID